MNPLQDWLSLILRWVHVIAGIMWIGSTYLFNWIERTFTPPDDAASKPNISGELWMVHGGGFYLVEKQKWPKIMPRTLHWFKWESMMTFLSGFLLLVVVYWCGAPLLPYGTALTQWQGIGISAGVLAGGVVVYNLLWNYSPLREREGLGIVVSWLLLVALSWGLTRVLSDRAAYLHIGAMFGAIMVANVWMIILPNQRKIMAITEAGGKPEPELSRRAGRCSRHNTYMSVPLIFTMISNHFPNITFGRDLNWLILGFLILAGWGAAKLIRDVL